MRPPRICQQKSSLTGETQLVQMNRRPEKSSIHLTDAETSQSMCVYLRVLFLSLVAHSSAATPFIRKRTEFSNLEQ